MMGDGQKTFPITDFLGMGTFKGKKESFWRKEILQQKTDEQYLSLLS